MKRATRSKPIVVKHHDRPDERRQFDKGLFRLVTVAGTEIGRAEYEPGWRWSTHVGPIAGTASCEVGDEAYVSLHLQGASAYAARHQKTPARKRPSAKPRPTKRRSAKRPAPKPKRRGGAAMRVGP